MQTTFSFGDDDEPITVPTAATPSRQPAIPPRESAARTRHATPSINNSPQPASARYPLSSTRPSSSSAVFSPATATPPRATGTPTTDSFPHGRTPLTKTPIKLPPGASPVPKVAVSPADIPVITSPFVLWWPQAFSSVSQASVFHSRDRCICIAKVLQVKDCDAGLTAAPPIRAVNLTVRPLACDDGNAEMCKFVESLQSRLVQVASDAITKARATVLPATYANHLSEICNAFPISATWSAPFISCPETGNHWNPNDIIVCELERARNGYVGVRSPHWLTSASSASVKVDRKTREAGQLPITMLMQAAAGSCTADMDTRVDIAYLALTGRQAADTGPSAFPQLKHLEPGARQDFIRCLTFSSFINNLSLGSLMWPHLVTLLTAMVTSAEPTVIKVIVHKLLILINALLEVGSLHDAQLLLGSVLPAAATRSESSISGDWLSSKISAAQIMDMPWEQLPNLPLEGDCLAYSEEEASTMFPRNLPRLRDKYTDENEYLASHYKLLRANALSNICSAIHSVRRAASTAALTASEEETISNNLKLHAYRVLEPPTLRVLPRDVILEFRFALATSQPKIDWTTNDRLMYGNLVAISLSGEFAFGDKEGDTIWGIIASPPDRDMKREMALERGLLYVTLVEDYSADALARICGHLVAPTISMANALLLESPTFFVASKFALKRLLDLAKDPVPLITSMVTGMPAAVRPPAYLSLCNINMPPYKDGVPRKVFHGSLISVLKEVETAIRLSDHQLSLDSSQANAIATALKSPVTVIQGPPGTGKTFVAATFMSMVLPAIRQSKGPLVIMTQKNHALDEMLLKLLANDSTIKCVRIGAGSKSERVRDNFGIRGVLQKAKKLYPHPDLQRQVNAKWKDLHLASDEINANVKLTRALTCSRPEWVHIVLVEASAAQMKAILCGYMNSDKAPITAVPTAGDASTADKDGLVTPTIEELLTTVDEVCFTARAVGDAKLLQQRDPLLYHIYNDAIQWWLPSLEDVATFLEVPPSTPSEISSEPSEPQEFDAAELQLLLDQRKDGDSEDKDTDFADKDTKPSASISIDPSGPSSSNIAVQGLGSALCRPVTRMNMLRIKACPDEHITHLRPEDRLQLIHMWRNNRLEQLRTNLGTGIKIVQGIMSDFAVVSAELDAAAMVSAEISVVAVTITGAAKNFQLLKALQPRLVVVEEAAEVLEATLVAAIPPSVEHLVLIGDHQQLQPMVDIHELGTHNGLTTSLFERLVNASAVKPPQLQFQGRMVPELSRLLKVVYPAYSDNAAVVNQLKPLECMPRAATLWLHPYPENQVATGYSNAREGLMVCGLAYWIAKNGTDIGKITVLTAYRAQSVLIRKQLDSHELCKGIKVCTIDNFQGEENDVILISLVRGNSNASTGFLRETNRLTVALSRARISCTIVGNATHVRNLRNGSPVWGSMITAMSPGPAPNSLQLCCPRHVTAMVPVADGLAATAANPKEFLSNFDVLCTRPCGELLPCGVHTCIKPCGRHGKGDHERCGKDIPKHCDKCGMKYMGKCLTEDSCTNPCMKRLSCGHPCKQVCSAPCTASEGCATCAKEFEDWAAAAVARLSLEEKPTMRKIDPTAEDTDKSILAQIQDAVRRNAQVEHAFDFDIVEIHEVTSVHPERRMYDAITGMFQPSKHTTKMFHGTRWANVESIIEKGFRVSRDSKSSGMRSMFGPAVYVTPDSTKAAQALYTGDEDPALMYCDVYLGKIKEFRSADHDAHLKRDAEHFDAAYAPRGTVDTKGVRFDEYAVYNPDLVVPRFAIRFRRIGFGSAAPARLVGPILPAHVKLVKTVGTASIFEVTKPGLADMDSFSLEYSKAEATYREATRGSAADPIARVRIMRNFAAEEKFKRCCEAMEMHYNLPAGAVRGAVQARYHGCPSLANLEGIQIQGFKVGGVDTAVVNGQVYGRGIYTSSLSSVAAGYGRGANAILCCVTALHKPGAKISPAAPVPASTPEFLEGDHHEVPGFCTVVFNAEQLLPRWALLFS